jgi:hypothetical protein
LLHHVKNADVMSMQWWIVEKVISQSDRSTHATCNITHPVKNDHDTKPWMRCTWKCWHMIWPGYST